MNANGHFEEDDLELYAMHLLAEPEASAVARRVTENRETRQALGEVQARLAAYAETAVDLQGVPEGSLERLMGRIAKEREKDLGGKVIAMPISALRSGGGTAFIGTAGAVRRHGGDGLLPWIGWVVAAGMTIAAGKLSMDRLALHRMLTAQTGQVLHMSADAVDVYRERDALTASLADRTRELESLRAETARAKGETEDLRVSTAGQARKLSDQAERLSKQTARAEEASTMAATAARERDTLRGTLAAQAGEVAQITSDAAKARQVQEALNDPSALRVTLTKPKTKPTPTGRATYVASRGTLVFLASNLTQLRVDKVYELWLIPADGSKPVATGTFVPDARGNASVISSQLSKAVAAKGFAVTIENAGGSQTPTLPLLLAGL